MQDWLKISRALISVYHKENLEPLISQLIKHEVEIWSTGGTADYIRKLGATVIEVSDLTGYPSILGGRVKTLHPVVHGGILARRDYSEDKHDIEQQGLRMLDLVLVDLYPFEETVKSGASDSDIIEKIDIGGIALIRAAAKNHQYVTCIPSSSYVSTVAKLLEEQEGKINLAQRRHYAKIAFDVSSHYDTHIYHYLSNDLFSAKHSFKPVHELRYGENPHQEGFFYGKLDQYIEQLNGKPLSYNNIVDIEAAIELIHEFEEPFFTIVKHTNPCGCAVGVNLYEAWQKALACDPVSAFGGIIACNGIISADLAREINKQVYDILIAKDYTDESLEELTKKKKRIILRYKANKLPIQKGKEILGGYLVQKRDDYSPNSVDWEVKTSRHPTKQEKEDMVFSDKVGKHLKSNAIAIVRNQQLIGSGVGQTSRISAINQAIEKARVMGFTLDGAILFSDAFFPFSDSVETSHKHGIRVVIQPGGSIRDKESIDFCEKNNMSLVFTGIRRFKH